MNALTKVVKRLIPKAWLTPISGWWPRVLESFAGAWQQNVVVDRATVTAYWAVFACVTLIAKDISKLAPELMREGDNGIFTLVKNSKIIALLNNPNHFQNRIEFLFTWVMSLLLNGNTYILKRRDANGDVDALYILDPSRVVVLVAQDGSVYYQLSADNLANVQISVTIPASEIIHDRMYTLYHPLIGVSPIYACGVAAMQGAAILDNSSQFFANMSNPSGILIAPGAISATTAATLKTAWETNYTGANAGRVAVLGDGLKYERMSVTAHDSQLIEQLRMTAEMVCACYHVPGYKIGVGPAPSINNTALLNQQYYDQCLQYPIEKIELRLDEGLEVKDPEEIWLNLSGLLRMDPVTRYEAHSKAIGGGWLSPNQARLEENMQPVPGGDTPYMQQQNYSLEALNRRDQADAAKKASDFQPSMDSTQLAAIQGLVKAAVSGEIPIESAKATLKIAYKFLTSADIDDLFKGVKADMTPPDEEDEPDQEQIRSYIVGRIAEIQHA